MLAVHIFPTFDSDGSASIATMFASGRGPAVFAMMAGVGLALVTGGQRPATGAARLVARVSLLTRAALLLLVGLLLGYATIVSDLDVFVILPYYAMMFGLTIPLLGLPPKMLAVGCVVLATAGDFLILTTIGDVADPSQGTDPTFGDFVRHPGAMVILLLFGGAYPAVLWMTYICAGMALGRLDLSSKLLARRLLVGGIALATAAWLTSSLLLFQGGGLRQLRENAPSDPNPWTDSRLLWEPWGTFDTYWWYVGRAPHSGTPFDMLHTLGAALAVFGAALLVTRIPRAVRLLRPLAAAGSMILTLYCAHILVLAVLSRSIPSSYYTKYFALLFGMIVFAVFWRRTHARGPLEEFISRTTRRVSRGAARRLRPRFPPEASEGDHPGAVLKS
jgi:uncharacterized membrane protein YeiB